MPGRVGLQGQDRATCCIAHPFGGYAANTLPRPILIPAPLRRSHTAKANPLRGIANQKQVRSALRVCWHKAARVRAALDCTQPVRGKSQAIEHNRALPKVGQSLRRASLGGLPLARPAGSGNGRLCLAPRPGQRLCRRRCAALSSSGAARWVVCGPLPRLWARALAGVAGGQFVVKVGAGETARIAYSQPDGLAWFP
jgi:hypothetical protein